VTNFKNIAKKPVDFVKNNPKKTAAIAVGLVATAVATTLCVLYWTQVSNFAVNSFNSLSNFASNSFNAMGSLISNNPTASLGIGLGVVIAALAIAVTILAVKNKSLGKENDRLTEANTGLTEANTGLIRENNNLNIFNNELYRRNTELFQPADVLHPKINNINNKVDQKIKLANITQILENQNQNTSQQPPL
jgi:hypothetical protein